MSFGFLAIIPLLSVVPLSFSSPKASFLVAQSVNQEIHKRCVEAKDYAGCVQSNGGKAPARAGAAVESKDSSRSEECSAGNVCVAMPGRDQLGLPKVVGWSYKYWPSRNVVQYWQMPPRRVPHKGQPDRYVAVEFVEHYYQQPIAAMPGHYQEITPKKKTCAPTFGGGTWVDGQWKPKPAGQTCTTTAATKVWVAGAPAVPGGPRSRSWRQVHDCKDKTEASYIDGRLRGNWSRMSSGWSYICVDRSDLKVLNMKL